MADEIKLRLTAEDNASSAIKKVIEALGETELGSAITAASAGFLALKEAVAVAGQVFDAVVNQFDRAIQAASEMELENRKLALSMANTGTFTEESFNAIQGWADEIEKSTGIAGGFAVTLVTVAKNMGMSTEQAQLASQAALDLSAATGIDANAALKQLNATLNGNAGRLGQMIPAVSNLTKAQLQNGEAIKLIAQQYEGFASGAAQTYAGANARLAAGVDKIYEGFGRMITQNPLVVNSINAAAEAAFAAAEAVGAFASLVIDNIDTIKNYAIAFGIATAAVGAYMVAVNASTIATTAATVATIAWNTALKLTPFGLVIGAVTALTIAIGYLIENFDWVSAKAQELAGVAIQAVVGALETMLTITMAVVRVFNSDLADSIQGTLDSWKDYGKEMEASGAAAAKMAEEADKAGSTTASAANEAAMAVKGLENAVDASAQAMKAASTEYAKALGDAEGAFAAVKDLTPRIALEKFKQDAAIYEQNLIKLKEKAEAMKVIIQAQLGAPSPEDLAQLEAINQKIREAEEAQRALKIKTAQEVRAATLKEIDIQLQAERDRTIALVDEIKLKRISAAQSTRETLIQIETERLLEERGLADANARAGVDVRTQAQLNANAAELAAYKAHLEASTQLAVDMETQKAIAVADAKKNAVSGLGGAVEGAAGADATVANEEARQQRLATLRQEGLLSEQEYNDAMTQSRIAAIQARNQFEIQLEQERAEALGLTEEGLAARQEAVNLEFQMKMETLQAQHEQELLTEQEFQAAKADLSRAQQEQMALTNQQYTQDEIKRHEALGESWKATLAKIRLEQQKHGQLLGTIRGIQQSEEFKATNQGLSDLASLRNSKSKDAFEVGKKAAIAQATINTFMSATAAYASLVGIPIVGPILATAAAAAALAAGFVQIQNINSQQFNAGGQADEGMDEVPKSMSGRSFILSGGERVLQPEANREVTEAARTINEGGGGMNATIAITINGNPDSGQISQLRDTIIDALREASERGTPIISEKGIVRN